MPVILTRDRDVDDGAGGGGPTAAAPLPDGTLKIVATGEKEDKTAVAT
jgi:hypothetical protein